MISCKFFSYISFGFFSSVHKLFEYRKGKEIFCLKLRVSMLNIYQSMNINSTIKATYKNIYPKTNLN